MSGEKQIEEMAKATMKHCKIDNQCGSCHWTTCNECLSEVLYNAGYRKQEWISVEEKLPPAFDRVIICDKYRRVNTDFFCGKNKGWYSGRTITHWMPLPEAPKMKGGAE
jgi:hypothetical protein